MVAAAVVSPIVLDVGLVAGGRLLWRTLSGSNAYACVRSLVCASSQATFAA